ncbi:MAG: VanZ family protein [Verrucomicrobiales bacterium]
MRILRHPALWACGFVTWFATLWWLSSRVHYMPPSLTFSTSDKILHFGWFFGGAGMLSAALFCGKPNWSQRTRILTVIGAVTLTGVIDEFHQSFVPGRQGNDLYDLTADFLGACAGSLLFLPFQRWFR